MENAVEKEPEIVVQEENNCITCQQNTPACALGKNPSDTKPSAACIPPAQQDGVLVLDKPGGMSSAACISHVKRGFGQKKIGHAGTLDPMATGVLLVLLGQGTKLSGYLLDQGEKIYSGTIRLGVTTDTWDMEGTIVAKKDAQHVTQDMVAEAMCELVGSYEQEVPAYSAAKHQGKPLYELARKGLATPVKKKMVTISCGEAELVGLPLVRFRVKCSSGTYIRSLAHSLGIRLGCGAALASLTREYSSPFGLDVACSLEQLQTNPEVFASRVLPISAALPEWPRVVVAGKTANLVKNGNAVLCADIPESPTTAGTKALLELEDGTPLALAEIVIQRGLPVWAILRGLWN